jgi:hypothetical protein
MQAENRRRARKLMARRFETEDEAYYRMVQEYMDDEEEAREYHSRNFPPTHLTKQYPQPRTIQLNRSSK